MEGLSPSPRKKKANALQSSSRKELQAYLIHLSLASDFVFQDPFRGKALNTLGKIATLQWSLFVTGVELFYSDALLLKDEEMQGIILIPISDNERRLSTIVKLIKTRITHAAKLEGLPPLLWKRALQTRPLETPIEIALVRRAFADKAMVSMR